MRITVHCDANPRLRDIDSLLAIDPGAARALGHAIDREFRVNEKALFRSEGEEGGSRWAALSPEYKQHKDSLFRGQAFARKAARKSGAKFRRSLDVNKILHLTGRMRRAFSQPGSEHVAEIDARHRQLKGRFGASVEYAKYHHEGGPRLKVRSPIQTTPDQIAGYVATAEKTLRPFTVDRMKRILSQWKGRRP